LEDQGLGGKMGSEWNFKEIGLGAWIGFDWLSTETGGGLLWVRWWTFGFLCHGVSLILYWTKRCCMFVFTLITDIWTLRVFIITDAFRISAWRFSPSGLWRPVNFPTLNMEIAVCPKRRRLRMSLHGFIAQKNIIFIFTTGTTPNITVY
jgi:hypothetical protein